MKPWTSTYFSFSLSNPASLGDIIMSIAKHYETGESLPEDVCLSIIPARTFRGGSQLLCQLRYAGVDLELHSNYVPGRPESIYDIDQRWAEVLAYDVFAAFEEAGLDNDQTLREIGTRFRETVLALGGGKLPNEVFLEFRGREPLPDSFLRYNGLLPAIIAA
ncbi:probable cytosolic oligopeptidase A [Olea europaea subsp. europaea]|uniref:Probable cytosolic oligopeptidase A n=1 Tax=Olea europaea subsp. europaea TaxID=158383 RepID=A0A8S0RK42_OLEEU|nr:probable cytosolic oligopeptidase A [Olea europaea subsp. europaea]